MKNLSMKLLVAGALFGGVLVFNSQEAKADEIKWTPRSVDEIKKDINGKEYTIQWGDTLSAISLATNITVEKLANWNSIANVDLIFAGNKLIFDGNVVTVQDSTGNVVSQSVVKPEEKNDANKPLGGNEGGNTGSGSTGGNEGGNTGSGSTGGNEGGNTGSGSTGGNEGGNTGGGSTGGNEGGNTGGGSTGGNEGGNTGGGEEQKLWSVWYVGESDSTHDIALGVKMFATEQEANEFIDKYADNLLIQGITSSEYGSAYMG